MCATFYVDVVVLSHVLISRRNILGFTVARLAVLETTAYLKGDMSGSVEDISCV
jgi:hypothetical protein